MADAPDVESGIMRHEHRAFFQIFGYLCPYFRKLRCICRIARMYSVNLYVPITIVIAFRADQPRTGFCNLPITYHTNARFANGSSLPRSGLKINGYKVYSLFFA